MFRKGNKLKQTKVKEQKQKVNQQKGSKFSFKNIKIGWKYGIAFIVVCLLFIAATAVVGVLLKGIGEDIDALERRGDRSIMLTEMGSLIRSKDVRILNYALHQDSKSVDEFKDRQEKFSELEALVREQMDTGEYQVLFSKVVENDAEMNKLFLEVIVPAMNNGDYEVVNRVSEQTSQLRTNTVSLLDKLRVRVNEERQMAMDNAKASAQEAFNTLIIAILVAIILGTVQVLLISRMVSRNLNKVVEVSQKIANADLTVENIDYKGNDEIGRLAVATNSMSDTLRRMVGQISEISETVSGQSEELTQSANEVKAGSEQVATTMQELASGAESQANYASDLASSMETFTTKVNDANENGEHIYTSSTTVLRMTKDGSQMMESSVQQMARVDQIVKEAVDKVQGLDTQSKEITKLVYVIKDIADQTNLLALNAAIEAARAGEHGRGFAVVADEVRKLAEQVGVSVTDITGIVEAIQMESTSVASSLQGGYDEVEKGTSQMKATGETFAEIEGAVSTMVESIQSVTSSLSSVATNSQEMSTLVQEIAAISEESAAGVEQTSASSQQTSSSMEEVASSSNELAKLAEKLNELVRQFKI